MTIKLSTGQILTVLSVVPAGSIRRKVMNNRSDVDITVIFKWDNNGCIMSEFPLNLHKGDKGYRLDIYNELMDEPRLRGIFNQFDNHLDVKFEETSSLMRSIHTRQSVEGLEVISCKEPMYDTSTWRRVSVLQHELFNKAHYLSSLQQRIYSMFKQHKVKDDIAKTYKNLSNVLYLKFLYQQQLLADNFVDTIPKGSLQRVKSLKILKPLEVAYKDSLYEIESFIEDINPTEHTMSLLAPYNKWLSVAYGKASFSLDYCYSTAIQLFEYHFESQQLFVSWHGSNTKYVYIQTAEEVTELLSVGSLGKACNQLKVSTQSIRTESWD